MYLEDGAERFADGLDAGGGEGKESRRSGVFGFQQLKEMGRLRVGRVGRAC